MFVYKDNRKLLNNVYFIQSEINTLISQKKNKFIFGRTF